MAVQLELMRIVKALLKAPAASLASETSRALEKIASLSGGGGLWLFHRVAGRLKQVGGGGRGIVLQGNPRGVAGLYTVRQEDNLLPSDIGWSAMDGIGLASATLLEVCDAHGLKGVLCFARDPQDPTLRMMLPELLEVILASLERHAREQTEREQSRRFVSSVNSQGEQIFELCPDRRFTSFAAGPTGLLQLSPKGIAGKSLEEALPAPVAELVAKVHAQAMETGFAETSMHSVELSGGVRILEIWAAQRLGRGSEFEVTTLVGIRDVTRQNHMHEEMLRLDSVMNAMSNLVVIIDAELRIQWVNSAFERQTGWKLAEVRGELMSDIVCCEDSDPDVVDGVARALRDVRPYSGEIMNKDRHGNRYWVDFNIVPYRNGDGTLAGFVSVETVVTRLKEQERATTTMAKTAAAAQARLENAINALPSAALIFDANERLVMRNQAYADLYPQLVGIAEPGITLAELVRAGARIGAFLPAYAPGSFDTWLRSELALLRAARDEREVERADGRWIHRISSRTLDGGLIFISTDITAKHLHRRAMDEAHLELTRALEERDLARDRFISIIEGAQVGTWEVDIRRQVLTFAGHWGQVLGPAAEELSELTLEEVAGLFHPDDAPKVMRIYTEGERSVDGLFEAEYRVRHYLGGWIWILARGRVTERDENGIPLRLVGVNLDVSERKRLEREVREREEHLTSAMESSVAAIAMIDSRRRLIYSNMEADRILQLTSGRRARGLGAAVDWVLEGIDGAPLTPETDPVEMAMRSGQTVRDVLAAVRWSDGARRVLTCNASPLEVGDSKPHVVLSFWDITDQLAATERLEQALAHAEEMSRAKSVFLANMSHEIRTPLNGVLGMTEVLGMQLRDPEHRRMIATIRDSGQTLLTVLNSILDMSKIEAGKMELEAVPFRLQDTVSQIEAVYGIQAEEKGVEFEVLISSDGDLPRVGDPHRIQQILHNLLSNALKFTSDGSVTLQVSCRRGRPVVFKVTDTGTGMTPEQSARVFESFEQADGSTTRRYGGTGLGLSIVRQLVTLMNGDIRLDSKLGRGTTITVELPLPEGQMSAPVLAHVEAEDDVQLGPLRILSADDNPTNREVLARMLEGTGITLQQAENGRQAVDYWQAAREAGMPFDMVLLDVTMPVLDGPSAVVEMRNIEAAAKLDPISVIAVTANAMPEQLAEYALKGFDSHLAKPFARKELIRSIRALAPKKVLAPI